MVAVTWVQSTLWQVQGPGHTLRPWEAAPGHETTQPVALTLASRLHVTWQVECQAPEVAQSEVLGLASLGTGALLLGPQPSFVDVGWCVGVTGESLGPAHGICGGESRRVVANGPQQP